MKKNISHITEDLMMDYVENNLSNNDKKDFEEILSNNNYLKERVDSLRKIIREQPIESVSADVHNEILGKLDIKKSESSARINKFHYLDKIVDYLTARPILLASSISCLVIFFITLSFNNAPSNGAGQLEPPTVLEEQIEKNNEEKLVHEEDEKQIK
tara:strand:- start:996 stop:1466 length:471 start_codon:yes stop_codon:yes gene_type:complete